VSFSKYFQRELEIVKHFLQTRFAGSRSLSSSGPIGPYDALGQLGMTSEGCGGMFEGDSADTCDRKFPLMLMWGKVEGLVCADPEARTPIGVSENFLLLTLTLAIVTKTPKWVVRWFQNFAWAPK
jgi:hypothetical protein